MCQQYCSRLHLDPPNRPVDFTGRSYRVIRYHACYAMIMECASAVRNSGPATRASGRRID
jgi:hypothetical protein